MSEYVAPKRRLNGSFGFVQVNGQDWGEISAFQSSIEVGYADVQMGLDVGKKMTSRTGSGSITVSKAYTRNAEIVESIKAGKTPEVRIVAWVSDPDATDGQEERIAIDNVEFTTIDILTFTHNELMTSEMPFTFMPSELHYLDRVAAPQS